MLLVSELALADDEVLPPADFVADAPDDEALAEAAPVLAEAELADVEQDVVAQDVAAPPLETGLISEIVMVLSAWHSPYRDSTPVAPAPDAA